MEPDARFDELVAPLRDDVVSGASDLSRRAADVLRRASVRIPAGSLEELRWGLGQVAAAILDAQPAMAPMVALVRDVLVAVERADSLQDGRHAAARAADLFRGKLEERATAVAGAALPILPVGGTVATLSSSGTVRRLLESEAAPRGISVLCFESRPIREGRMLASALGRAGVEVTYAVDAAAHTLVASCDTVLLGADSIGDLGVVNKIGSAALAYAARGSGVPVYVLADRTKVLPRGFVQALDDDRPASEVWDAPAGVRIWNRYFEALATSVVTAFVSEDGIETPEDLERHREALELPPGLRAWAASRAGDTETRPP